MKERSRMPYRLYRRDGLYYADFKLGNRRIRQSLKTGKAGLASKRLAELVRDGATGKLDGQQNQQTIKEWADEYVHTHLSIRERKSGLEARRALEREILPYLHRETNLSDVSVSLLIRMKTDLWGKKGLPSQNRKIALVKHFFGEAQRRGLIADNPARGLKKRRESPNRSCTLSDKQLKELIFACGEPLRTFVIVAVATGLRPAEMLQLRWKNVEKNPQTGDYSLFLANGKDLRTKNGKNRRVPLHPRVVDSLLRLRARRGLEDLVFAPERNGRHYTYRRVWKEALKRVGLTDIKVTPYSLRRTFGTILIHKGESITNIRDLYGHTDVTTTQRYLDTSDEQLKSTIHNGLESTMDAIGIEQVNAENGVV